MASICTQITSLLHNSRLFHTNHISHPSKIKNRTRHIGGGCERNNTYIRSKFCFKITKIELEVSIESYKFYLNPDGLLGDEPGYDIGMVLGTREEDLVTFPQALRSDE